MVSNRLRTQIILRAVLLGATIMLFYYLASHNFSVTASFTIVLFILEIYQLIYYVEKTNRDLARFINSIKFSDFSQSFNDRNYGSSFKELHKAFANITEQFQKTRSETEEHSQYLQTVVKHIKIGLISFDQKGDIKLINEAAKELLNIEDIINIKQLNSINSELVEVLETIGKKNKSLVKLNINGLERQISLAAASFRMKGRNFTLVSLQDISGELENERLSSQLEIARDAQNRLLPKENPVVPGYSICAKCIPANEVGGDYYDFIQLDDNRIGIVIADVSGKGIASAFYMTLTKGVFQSYACDCLSPKEVLMKLNQVIYRTIDKKSFVTMFYAILDYKNNKITYARAGHEPIIYSDKNAKALLQLKPDGIGLGLERGELFSKTIVENEILLSEGDALFFYTDGITDSKNRLNQDLGINGLMSLLNKCSRQNSLGLMDQLFERISEFGSGSPQYDDMTMIVLARNN